MMTALALLFLVLMTAVPARARDGVRLGVVEHLGEKEAMARDDVGTGNYKQHVRFLFQKLSLKWFPLEKAGSLQAAVKALPEEAEWQLCLQGKALGRFTTRRPESIKIAALVGSHTIPPDVQIPRIGPLTTDFSGWHGEKAPRPLVVTTGTDCRDLDLWKRDPKSTVALKPLLKLLRREIRKPGWRKLPENEAEPESYSFVDKKASILEVHESALDHRKIVSLAIQDKLLKDHVESFFVAANGHATYLGASLRFLDAGNYDSATSSHIVLRIQGFNRDGYTLVSPDGNRVANTYWSYH